MMDFVCIDHKWEGPYYSEDLIFDYKIRSWAQVCRCIME